MLIIRCDKCGKEFELLESRRSQARIHDGGMSFELDITVLIPKSVMFELTTSGAGETPAITVTALDDDELAKGEVTVVAKMEQPPEGSHFDGEFTDDGKYAIFHLYTYVNRYEVYLPYPKGTTVDTRHCLSRGYGGKNIYHNITATVSDAHVEERDGEWVELVTLTKEE